MTYLIQHLADDPPRIDLREVSAIARAVRQWKARRHRRAARLTMNRPAQELRQQAVLGRLREKVWKEFFLLGPVSGGRARWHELLVVFLEDAGSDGFRNQQLNFWLVSKKTANRCRGQTFKQAYLWDGV